MKAHLVLIAKCYSGLLGPAGSKYNKIAIATRRALNVFDQQTPVQNAVRTVTRTDAHLLRILEESGMAIQIFRSQYQDRDLVNVGMFLNRPGNKEEELAMYHEAQQMLRSLEEGVHRRVFFKTKGVETPEEIKDLPPNLYSALLAKIKTHYDPEMRNIGHISVADNPLDWVGTMPDGAKKIVFSRSLLERAPYWSSIEEKSEDD